MFLHSNNDKTASLAPRREEEPHGGARRSMFQGSLAGSNVHLEKFGHFPRESAPPRLQRSMDRDSQSEDTLSSIALENIKNKLIHAFRVTESREESGCSVTPASMSRSYQANEELRRAKIDGAITWLRSELVSGCSLMFVGCSST